jgi:hypothetical protein
MTQFNSVMAANKHATSQELEPRYLCPHKRYFAPRDYPSISINIAASATLVKPAKPFHLVIRKLHWFAILLAVSGCATPDPITVRVPVAIKCIDKIPERPALRTDTELAALESDYDLIIHIARDRRLYQGWTAELEAVVEGCR